MISEHARLAPSSAFRWLNCPGSIAVNEAHPETATTFDAAQGTMVHAVRADCLRLGLDPEDFVGTSLVVDGHEIVFTKEMAEHIGYGIRRLRSKNVLLDIEHRVDLGRWMPGQFGTLDAGYYTETEIGIDDLKYGFLRVFAPRNKQLMVYALGYWDNIARHHTDATEFVLNIDQPRAYGGGGEWRVSLDELLAFAETLPGIAARAQDPDAPRIPSAEACAYCAGAEVTNACRQFTKYMCSLMQVDVDAIDEMLADGELPPAPGLVTPERRTFLIEHGKLFSQYINRLEQEALDDALVGRPAPGLKAVLGNRGARKWDDEFDAELRLMSVLGAHRFTTKLKSPAQVEKEIGKPAFREKFKDLASQSEAKPLLVPVDDARAALVSAQSKFDETDEG